MVMSWSCSAVCTTAVARLTPELLLARDRLGVKPLYYAPLPDGVLFGSEPKATLAHPGFRAEIDAEGLAEMFSQAGTGTPGHGV
jgi:asparagine synthase (glutamine-hydrolysing)